MVFRRKKKQTHTGLMALADVTVKFAQAQVVLDSTEAELERELERDQKRKPTTKIAKARMKGEKMLHSKNILLCIVVLNVLDCLLVLGELMLDIKYVTDLLTKEYERSDTFVGSMKGLYPDQLDYLGSQDIHTLENELLIATIHWNRASHSSSHDSPSHDNLTSHDSHVTSSHRAARSLDTNVLTERIQHTTPHGTTDGNGSTIGHSDSPHGSHGNDSDSHGNDHGGAHSGHHEHSIEEQVAHALHKASITILGILALETFSKIFCLGKEMCEHRLECFDSAIVIASFIVDIVFLKGLQQFTVEEFVLILAFMVPWRIIRVVNSLVVAIMLQEHYRLKVLYKQKKKISNELKEAKAEIKGLESCVDILEKACADAGLDETYAKNKLLMYRKVQNKSNVTGAFTNYAVGGDALTNSFSNGPTEHHHVINIENDNLKGESQGDVVKKSKTQSQDLLEKLAESSASFIATINKDDQEARMRAISIRSARTDSTNELAEESTESLEEDTAEDSNKTEIDELVNEGTDNTDNESEDRL